MTDKAPFCAIHLVLAVLLATGCQSPGDESLPKKIHTENGVLFVNDTPFIPAGVYFWPDISSPTGRNPFEDITQYGLNALVAYYEAEKTDGDLGPLDR